MKLTETVYLTTLMLRIIPEKEFYWCFSHWTLCVVVTWRAL